MTKLVTILARELVEWPECVEYGCDAVMQDGDGRVCTLDSGHNGRFNAESDQWGSSCSTYIDSSTGSGYLTMELAEDYTTAIITREMWQAERERLNAPEWDGEGLPPVVAIVLNRHGEERRVVAHDGDIVVCAAGVGHYRGYTKSEQLELRPIKSDRDRWIEAAFDIANSGECRASLHGIVGIYDAMKSGKLSVPEVE